LKKTAETKEPIVSKKNQSDFLNFKSAVLILGVSWLLDLYATQKMGGDKGLSFG
jgi:hypothetical protein